MRCISEGAMSPYGEPDDFKNEARRRPLGVFIPIDNAQDWIRHGEKQTTMKVMTGEQLNFRSLLTRSFEVSSFSI